jgi:predicted kinase
VIDHRLQVEAEAALRERLVDLIAAGRRVVVDVSLWKRAHRDQYKDIAQNAGGTWRLIYFKTDPGEVRRRLELRATRFDANAAFPITEQVLQQYMAGFEAPSGEDEEVIEHPPLGTS